MKTCAIMQPTYLPWLGYFDLIRSADVFVFLDHVQFSKQSWQQRNKLRDRNGEQLLTVNIRRASTRKFRINEVRIDRGKRPLIKHLKSIRTLYAKSRNFKEVFPELERIYTDEYEYLSELNIALIHYGAQKLGVTAEFIRSSTLNVSQPKVEGVVEICQRVQCDKYVSPVGARTYIDENDIFSENGILLEYQSYVHICYQQIDYPNFISHLAFIDYLFNK